MIQFTEKGVELTASSEALAQAATEFQSVKLLRIPGLLEPGFLETIRSGIERDGFDDGEGPAPGAPEPMFKGAYQGVKVGDDLRAGETSRLIQERSNDPRLLDFVQQMVGCSPLEQCVGRIFRLAPMKEDLPWHTDAEGGRVADLIIDLATEPFDGGLFQMRDAHSQKIINEVDKLAFGDALLVRISPDLEHHYKAIKGSVPKITFSGWFVPQAN